MTHHRERFERVYALSENVVPAELLRESSEDEADRFLIKKELSFSGLGRLKRVSDSFLRGLNFERSAELQASLLSSGEVIEVKVEGWKEIHAALASDLELLQELSAGRIPQAWQPLDTTNDQEALFLAPLDQVSARGRAKQLFSFDYVWEVYKPEQKRKYGYYVLPILWGDRLVGRFDSKLDRSANRFQLLGFWLEDQALGADHAFAEALGRGYERFVRFLGADSADFSAIPYATLRDAIERMLAQSSR